MLSMILTCLLAFNADVIETYQAKVIAISDGDTLKVLKNNKQVTIRLEAIDAPESKQAFGTKSKNALADLVYGKVVTVKRTGEDKYGRTLAFLMVGNESVNTKMIQNGMAWHFKKYNQDIELANFEEEARKTRTGLWIDPNPVSPWDFRAKGKSSATPNDGKYWLNTSSKTRHNSTCDNFMKTKSGRMCGPNEGKACGKCGG